MEKIDDLNQNTSDSLSFGEFNSSDKNVFNKSLKSKSPDVVTLGSLYSKDVPNGYFMPERPSSFNPRAKFRNDERYTIHDYPPWPLFFAERLKPIQISFVVGNELPILMRYFPAEELKTHWKKWIPFFPLADARDLVTEDTGDSKLITYFPIQSLPKEKHANDPDMHHKVLCKLTIPEMGAVTPNHMTVYDYHVPCMIKVTHGVSGRGTFMVKTKQEAETLINKLRDEVKCPEPSISEVIEDITGNYCVQFYLFKTGEIHWLGCSRQTVTDEFEWDGGYIDWNKQDELKRMYFNTVMPVKEYLHKKGYFGVVGIDVLSNKEDNYVVDVNARINGSTSLLLIAPHMAAKGFTSSALLIIPDVKGNESELIEKLDQINSESNGIVIDLASVENPDGKSCEAHICMFAKSEQGVKNLYSKIINQ
uniref:Uncharacterized protein LOC116302097 n=1 Tax=Actinia tenebrosa TaxID=6105 RepID=A0A6P8IJS0_ACTTE